MSKNRSVNEVVEVLRAIYEESFGGKSRGRYKLTRSQFRILCGRSRLEAALTMKIVDAALDEGIVLIELGDHFCVIEESAVLAYRPVPKNVGTKYLPASRLSMRDSSNEDEDEEHDVTTEIHIPPSYREQLGLPPEPITMPKLPKIHRR